MKIHKAGDYSNLGSGQKLNIILNIKELINLISNPRNSGLLSNVKIKSNKLLKSRKFISESAEKKKKEEPNKYYPNIQKVLNLPKKPVSEGHKSKKHQKNIQISLFN